jgi:hypothetical protein
MSLQRDSLYDGPGLNLLLVRNGYPAWVGSPNLRLAASMSC